MHSPGVDSNKVPVLAMVQRGASPQVETCNGPFNRYLLPAFLVVRNRTRPYKTEISF